MDRLESHTFDLSEPGDAAAAKRLLEERGEALFAIHRIQLRSGPTLVVLDVGGVRAVLSPEVAAAIGSGLTETVEDVLRNDAAGA